MIDLIVLVILWTPFVVPRLVLRVEHARTPTPPHPRPVWAEPPSGAKTAFGSQPGPVWGALDDRQLTRLLTDSAPPSTISE